MADDDEPGGAPTLDDIGALLGDAISGVLGEQAGCMVNRWVLTAETIEPDGQRGLWTIVAPSTTRWDSLGMLHHAINSEVAAHLASMVGDER